jgi:Organic solute transporter Ostalpha
LTASPFLSLLYRTSKTLDCERTETLSMWNENHVDGEGEDEGSARDMLHHQRATGSTEFQTSSIQPLHAESERVVLISQSYDEDRDDEGNDLGEALLASPPSSQRRNRFRFSVPFSSRDDGPSRWLSRPLQVLQQMNPGMNRQASSGPPDDEPSWWLSRPIELLQQMNPGMNRQAARSMLRTVGDYLAFGTLLTMFVCFPMVLYRALSNRNLDLAAWNSAGVMVCGTLVLSSRQVYLHLTHWYMPEVQKYVVRIMCMPPIYSIQSWLSLRFHESRLYMDSIRDLYEAFVIASFVYYLIELLGGQEALIQILLQKREAGSTLGRHPFPLRLILQPWYVPYLTWTLECVPLLTALILSPFVLGNWALSSCCSASMACCSMCFSKRSPPSSSTSSS